MALYGAGSNVHTSNQPERYSMIREIGDNPTLAGAGIYQCQTCHYEDVVNRECKSLPPVQTAKRKVTQIVGNYLFVPRITSS